MDSPSRAVELGLGAALAMPALRLSFTPVRRRGPALSWALLALGIGLSVWVAVALHNLWNLREAQGRRLDRLQAAAQAPVRVLSSAQRATTQTERAVRQGLGANWNPVFDAMEQSVTPEVAVLTVRVTARSGSLDVQGQAAHLSDVLEFVRRLQRQPGIHVVLLRRDKLDADEPGHPFNFVVHAELTP